ncbi:hypothetical protein BFJ68_g1599 [Fusarium oxysporum]|uniref:Uncharacterized protein n=2 Tax=Fusarium oxysporum TaxID=5507 RepID=A0A420RZA8_FUSOX|nr:hypothetical protein BFJ65_g7722 [Fusarium oxysporum f. sp. cepae]RKK44583.1 hypothetical protein BFJ66_g9476 [Fusarium oxysporum f. sp. cepae]RKK51500.1 hypothetical protein BFJ67_g6025 [Fusarium oxysporum f. sp. cepae]RKK86490.1 hypothetical protein BFJ71_g13733 [Fusarium oxysporum]RKL22351.1 hypothetical protein BFJ68_g1599 [Fusarium oxysporum]
MFMRNVLIAAVSLQALVEGVIAQEKVTLTRTVTRQKPKTSAGNPYEVPDVPEVTVVPTSYITDGTTIFVDETVTIPCSRCTASTAGDADAEVTSEVITTVITSDAGSVSDQTAEVTVIPTSYITDGTTIFVDETVTIPCSKCTATSTAGDSDAEGTSEAVSETVPESEALSTADVTTSGDAAAAGTSEAVSEASSETVSEAATTEVETLSTAEATNSGSITEQTADVTTVVPTSFITRGTTRYVNQTITIPCTKCAGGKTKTVATGVVGETTLDTSAALETTGATQDAAETSAETSAPVEEETTDVDNATQTANTATNEADASTETEAPIPTTIILTTGKGQSTVATQPGPFANTTVAAGAETTGSDELPGAVSSEAATSSAVVSKVNKPVIVVIREVTIFHRTVVIGAACPPVKRGNKGDFVVGTGSDEKTFPELGEALTDACDKQFKDCSENAGKNFEVSDCQKQREICRADASSTAKAPTPITKESTETASVILPSDAEVTGKTKPGVGGHVVISTRTLTVSESCAISDGTPVIEGPTSTGAVKTTETAAAETTSDAEAAGSTALGVETSEAATETAPGAVESSEAVTVVTMTKSDGEISTIAITLTNGVPTGTGVVPPETQVDSSAEAAPTSEAAETSGDSEAVGSTALGAETSEADETVTATSTGVVIITMTKSDGEISTTAITVSNGVPTGTGVVTVPGEGEKTTVVVPPAETSEGAIGQETTVPAAGETVITKTVTNQVTSYVTVGVNTMTVGVETVTLTNQVTETVTVPCGAGKETAKVITSVVTACPASTTLATTRAPEPETVYVTATVEAARLHSDVPAPERFRRMLGFW